MPYKLLNILILFIFLFSGCASINKSSYYTLGKESLENQEYDAAIQAFSRQLKQDINDLKSVRELGIAYYKKGELRTASRLLLYYIQKEPENSRGLLYLAAVYEKMHDLSKALYFYRKFNQTISDINLINIIRTHVQYLYRKAVRKKIKTLLASDSLTVEQKSRNRIMILNFLYAGKNPLLQPVSKGIADVLISDMTKLRVFKVVPRIEMQELVSALDFGEFGYFNEEKCLRMAKLLGASILIKGIYNDVGENRLVIGVNIIKVDSKKIITIKKVEGNFTEVFDVEKKLLYRILRNLGTEISKEKWQLASVVPTKNFLAFVSYSAGLDYEDKELYEKATQCFTMAFKLDTDFLEARQAQRRTELSALLKSDIFEVEEIARRIPEETEKLYFPPTQEYMGEIAGMLTSSFLPGLDARNPVRDGVQNNFGETAVVTVQLGH